MSALELGWSAAGAADVDSQESFKLRYVVSLAQARKEIASLRETIKDCIDAGIRRQALVRWAEEAGYSTGYVRSLLSRILRELGVKSRKAGGGRKIPWEAVALRTLAQKHYGDEARRFLLAAYRAQEPLLRGRGFSGPGTITRSPAPFSAPSSPPTHLPQLIL
jgi:hypothetical protein